jgi:hypothetical protein
VDSASRRTLLADNDALETVLRLIPGNVHTVNVIDLETCKSSTLTATDAAALYPTWSANGDVMAFIAGPDAGDVWGGDLAKTALNGRHLWIMDADGSHKRRLT